MNTGKLRTAVAAVMFCAATAAGMSACNKGTEPGEVNVERSGIEEEGSMIDADDNRNNKGGNNASEQYEHHYDHADHPDSTAIGDGAYKQEGERQKRP